MYYLKKEIKFILTIVFVGLFAFLLALTVRTFLVDKLTQYEEIKLKRAPVVRNYNVNRRKSARNIIKKNIFNSSLSFDDVPEKKEEEIVIDNSTGEEVVICEESSIAVEIQGTLPATPKKFSYVAVYDRGERKMQYYSIGDKFIEDDVRVYDIRRSVVMLKRGNKIECLFLGKKPKKKSSSYKSAKINKNNNRSGSRIDVKQVSENRYVVDAEDINREFKDLSKISREARGVFAKDKKNPGQTLGFKIFAIKRGSLFEKIGIKNGDIIESINGERIDNPDRALEFYSKFKDGISDLKVNIIRHNKKRSIDYSIK